MVSNLMFSIFNRAEQDSLKIYHISMINDIFRAIDMKLNTLVASRGAALIRGAALNRNITVMQINVKIKTGS